ncbi:MAG: S26 family signal peptidase [Planctomycetota bacterium]|jgi:hypothetical protein
MECPNCTFQNIPGTARCARCESRLDFDDVDYLPPRAGGGMALRRTWWRARSMSSSFEQWWATAASRARGALHPGVSWTTLLWSFIPGLGHLRQGHAWTGLLLLGIWTLLVILAVVFAGSGLSWLMASGAVGFHCLVVSLVMAPALRQMSFGQRLRTGLVIYLGLIVCLYGPAIFVGRGCFGVMPLSGLRGGEAVANGDVVLYSGRWLRPGSWHRGDLVVYRVRPYTAGNMVVRSGWGVDRIIGLPGDRVVYDGALTVNGADVPAQGLPIGGLTPLPELDMVLGPGEVAVLPSALALHAQGGDIDRLISRVVVAASRVREEDVAGHVWWRLRPWNRFGPLD